MALEFLNNAKDNFINALFGTPTQVEGSNQSIGYGKAIDNYLNNLGEQEYIKKLLNKPVEERMSLDTIRKGVANGLNYSVPEIAQAQKELGINTPKTGEEIYKAQLGEFNQPTTLNVGVSNAPRQGGLINDFISGFRENATQGFDVNNLAPQRKGLATRIGEGLGTLARFYDKPIGRMAVATGLSMLTDEANPLGEGVKAYVGRQTNMTRDKAYRQGLINMGVDADEVNAIPGIMTDDVFKNYTLANYRNNMTNYRNLKLDKDTYIKQQQNIYKMLNDGVITAKEATRQMQLLNDEYQKQNPMDMQESNKTVQGNRRLDILEQQGNRRNDILQQNANTYATKVANDGKDNSPKSTDETNRVRVQAPNGQTGTIPRAKLREAIAKGYKVI